MESRLQYERPICYSSKVLIGNWIDKRIVPNPPGKTFYSNTTYRDCYTPPPIPVGHADAVWNKKLETEDNNLISQLGRYDFPNFFENFSTIYDLSYNHFPKCIKDIPRKYWLNLEGYLPSFGNLTKYGLLDSKKEEWKCDGVDPRKTCTTETQDTYQAPGSSAYKFKRWGIPLPNSSIMYPPNLSVVSMKLRGKTNYTVPPPEELVPVCRPNRCNVITWECPRKIANKD